VYVIPVAVHIVHLGGPENIADAQVQSQIYALNRDFANTPGKARRPSTRASSSASPEPAHGQHCHVVHPAGITRTNSPETNHTYGNLTSETNSRPSRTCRRPGTQYLGGEDHRGRLGGSGGYGTYPGLNPPTLDGIVCLASVFGQATTRRTGSSFRCSQVTTAARS